MCKLVVEALLYSFLAVINSTVIQLLIRKKALHSPDSSQRSEVYCPYRVVAFFLEVESGAEVAFASSM